MSSTASDSAKEARRNAMAKQLRTIDISVTIVAGFFVSLRFWARSKSRAGAGLDDWLILAALVSDYMYQP